MAWFTVRSESRVRPIESTITWEVWIWLDWRGSSSETPREARPFMYSATTNDCRLARSATTRAWDLSWRRTAVLRSLAKRASVCPSSVSWDWAAPARPWAPSNRCQSLR